MSSSSRTFYFFFSNLDVFNFFFSPYGTGSYFQCGVQKQRWVGGRAGDTLALFLILGSKHSVFHPNDGSWELLWVLAFTLKVFPCLFLC